MQLGESMRKNNANTANLWASNSCSSLPFSFLALSSPAICRKQEKETRITPCYKRVCVCSMSMGKTALHDRNATICWTRLRCSWGEREEERAIAGTSSKSPRGRISRYCRPPAPLPSPSTRSATDEVELRTQMVFEMGSNASGSKRFSTTCIALQVTA